MLTLNQELATRAEVRAELEFRKYVRKAAAAATPIAHFGDGNGGYLISIGMDEFKRAGVYRDSNRSPNYRKKKIKGWLRTEVYERDEYACVQCGARKNLSIDHIVPEVKGGETVPANLQTMCRPCNSKKGARG